MGITLVRCEKMYGNLEEKVCLEIPLRFETHGGRNKVCLLKYGLNEFPKA